MISATDFIDLYAELGAKKASSPFRKLFSLGMLAGFLNGMAGIAYGIASYSQESVSAARLAGSLIFPFGLIMVIYSGAELFTGNNLITISVLNGKTTVGKMLRSWLFVYLGNFAGSIILAAGYVYAGIFFEFGNNALALAIMETAAYKTALPFTKAIILGFFCNILVCIAVMGALMNKDGISRAAAAYFPVAFFVIAGFEQSVANMYYISAGLFLRIQPFYQELAMSAGMDISRLTTRGFLLNNMLPVTLGNIFGGVLFSFLVFFCHRKRD
ncbi:MAG: formate/nitrite transporter family protein [Clostridiaceae bacterium]|jgi:formate/nitrite transporter|nr:formate/nitrite transporter family protein [Clostridiaceae bacterium]